MNEEMFAKCAEFEDASFAEDVAYVLNILPDHFSALDEFEGSL